MITYLELYGFLHKLVNSPSNTFDLNEKVQVYDGELDNFTNCDTLVIDDKLVLAINMEEDNE